jgi:hypothetical protein
MAIKAASDREIRRTDTTKSVYQGSVRARGLEASATPAAAAGLSASTRWPWLTSPRRMETM